MMVNTFRVGRSVVWSSRSCLSYLADAGFSLNLSLLDVAKRPQSNCHSLSRNHVLATNWLTKLTMK